MAKQVLLPTEPPHLRIPLEISCHPWQVLHGEPCFIGYHACTTQYRPGVFRRVFVLCCRFRESTLWLRPGKPRAMTHDRYFESYPACSPVTQPIERNKISQDWNLVCMYINCGLWVGRQDIVAALPNHRRNASRKRLYLGHLSCHSSWHSCSISLPKILAYGEARWRYVHWCSFRFSVQIPWNPLRPASVSISDCLWVSY